MRRYSEVPDGLTYRCGRNTRCGIAGGAAATRSRPQLKAAGVPTAIYYAKPLHRQTAYRDYPAAGTLPVSERLSGEVLSLPMHPYLEGATQEMIVKAIVDAI